MTLHVKQEFDLFAWLTAMRINLKMFQPKLVGSFTHMGQTNNGLPWYLDIFAWSQVFM